MSDLIELRKLRCSAVVGVLAEERERAQPLVFDIDLARSFDEAAARDDVGATTNYASVLALVVQVATDGRFKLLETLARRVANVVLALDDALTSVTVAVRKVRPPVPEDVASVGVRCSLQRP